MAVGLKPVTRLSPIAGIKLATVAAGIKSGDNADMVVISCEPGTHAAAVFTQNRFCAAPVQLAKDHIAQSDIRACLINSGNANAGTGQAGLDDAKATCSALAAELGVDTSSVLPFSTGVIGQRLPVGKMTAAIPSVVAGLEENAWVAAAQGIMTTDTVAKGVSKTLKLNAGTITVTGIAKGAGMIRPDMATLLVFIATDADIVTAELQKALTSAVDVSFNRITVDGDTSTNDSCLLLASGKSGVSIAPDSDDMKQFVKVLTGVTTELAQAVIRDAEGINKFITIDVINGASEKECLDVAYTVAHSPLVKTAFFASDANWGRILAAVGRAPIDKLDIEGIRILLNDVCIVENGAVATSYTEEAGQAVMSQDEITITIDLEQGGAGCRIWTSDLSHDYVRINAEYRT
ncbi:MAG: bifunctional glutamate N-acetyltransferase/amino-acid acetyltransferase ArgJ [Proteobacteria bacterium]|nr:bifunctional glutamate N-acetyltransferase/amino-acid acetyltransferase ArgJ [Pseudomonadota bacterium]